MTHTHVRQKGENSAMVIDTIKTKGRVKVVVATTVMLSFISFWRAAAIVLNDLGSSAYYVGGIAEKAVGRSAPWFILGVMLFSYAVRAVRPFIPGHVGRRIPGTGQPRA